MSEPEVLYHYTTAQGLLGIVEGAALWATNADFLNDARELKYGRQELYDALRKRADELSPEEPEVAGAKYSQAAVMRSAVDHLSPGGIFARREHHVVYVACFCEEGDLLSQWRGYGAPGGYAVGFRASDLRLAAPTEAGTRAGVHNAMVDHMAQRAARRWRWLRRHGSEPDERLPPRISEAADLLRVRYGDAAVEDAIATVLQRIAPEPVGHPGVQGYARAQSVVLPALAGIKHDAFREEREWRLVVVTDEHVPSFRTGPLGVTPYIEVGYPPGAIADVVIGPGPETQVRERGVRQLLAKHATHQPPEDGGDAVVVRSSVAPFRG
jgi:hypothetical protein